MHARESGGVSVGQSQMMGHLIAHRLTRDLTPTVTSPGPALAAMQLPGSQSADCMGRSRSLHHEEGEASDPLLVGGHCCLGLHDLGLQRTARVVSLAQLLLVWSEGFVRFSSRTAQRILLSSQLIQPLLQLRAHLTHVFAGILETLA